jgi:hypothetical protein
VLGVSAGGVGLGLGAVLLPVCQGAAVLGFGAAVLGFGAAAPGSWGVVQGFSGAVQGFSGAVQGFWGVVQGFESVVAGVLVAAGTFQGAETGAWFPSPGNRLPPLSRQSPQARATDGAPTAPTAMATTTVRR